MTGHDILEHQDRFDQPFHANYYFLEDICNYDIENELNRKRRINSLYLPRNTIENAL